MSAGIRFSKSDLLKTVVGQNSLKLQQQLRDIEDGCTKSKKKSVADNTINFLNNCHNKWYDFQDLDYIISKESELDIGINNQQDQILKLVYRIPAKELNINRKLSWVLKHKFSYQDKEYGYLKTKYSLYLNKNHGLSLLGHKVKATIQYYVSRNIDDDNLDGTFKHMRDGIYLALGIDDKAQISSTREVNKIKGKNEYLILTLEKAKEF